MKINNLVVKRESFSLEIDSLSFSLEDKVAIIGKSGSGKTTLLNAIASVINYDCNINVAKSTVVYATQFGDLIEEFSVKTNVIMGSFGSNNVLKNILAVIKSDVSSILIKFGIDSLGSKKVKSISGGEAQRVLIARSLNTRGEVYLFDEPTSSLDVTNSEKSIEVIMNELTNKLVICNVHNLDLLKYFNRVIILENGKVVGDTTDITNKDFKNYFD